MISFLDWIGNSMNMELISPSKADNPNCLIFPANVGQLTFFFFKIVSATRHQLACEDSPVNVILGL